METVRTDPCPFCGGGAVIAETRIYRSEGVAIKCKECGARTRTVLCDTTYQWWHGRRNVYITRAEAIEVVKGLWERRNHEN